MEKLNTVIGAGQTEGDINEAAIALNSRAMQNDQDLWLSFRNGDQKAYTLLLRNHANI